MNLENEDRSRHSLLSIAASEDKPNYALPYLIIAGCGIVAAIVTFVLINFVAQIDRDLAIAITVCCSVAGVLFALLLIHSLRLFVYFLRMLNGAMVINLKVSGIKYVSLVDDNPSAIYSVKCLVEKNGDNEERMSFPVYHSSVASQIKKMRTIPVLYNPNYDQLLFFTLKYLKQVKSKKSL